MSELMLRTTSLYLDAINGDTKDPVKHHMNKLSLLKDKNPNSVLSIGVGGGEEIQALQQLFPNAEVIGLDISPKTVETAREKASGNYVLGNSLLLPFKRNSVDTIILSCVLHEVYSYMPNKLESWRQAVRSAVETLAPEGTMLVRDPAAPSRKDFVITELVTPEAIRFYDYFSESFVDTLPLRRNRTVQLERTQAAEMLMHFRNFMKDLKRGDVDWGDINWKELTENYFIYDQGVSLSPQQYMTELETSTKNIRVSKFNMAEREETNIFLSQHFVFESQGESSKTIINDCTRKMEIVLKKYG